MGFLSWIFGKKSTCPQCGAKVKAEYNFCPECKTNSVGAWLLCTKCQNPIKGDMKFCPYCREPLDPARTVRETAAVVWRRRKGQFAVRYELDPEFIQNIAQGEVSARAGVIVEFGTRALMFVDGRLVQTLDAGRYVEFTGLGKSFDKATTVQNRVVVALISAGDTDLTCDFAGLRSKDNFMFNGGLRYTVRLKDPAAFFENVMKGEEEVLEENLNKLIAPELHNALFEFVRGYDAETLESSMPTMKPQAESIVLNHFAKTFGRIGVEFVQIRFVNFGNPDMGNILQERKDREVAQKRLELLNRAQQQEVQQLINAATNEAEAQKALMKVGLDRILSKQEADELAQAWADGRGDVAMARQQFQEKIKIMYEVELQKVRLVEEGKLGLEQIEIAGRQLKGQLENERMRRVEMARIAADEEREGLKLTKEKADIGLDIRRRRQELDMSQKQREMEIEKIKIDSLKGMSSDQIKFYLASQKPELIEALKAEAEAKAQAERNKDLKVVYENIMNMVKDVTIAASTGKVATANDAAQFVKIGAMAGTRPGLACIKCGAKLEQNFVICPQCGADQPGR
jgi:membrane protease subunit (stomatin/prohibitin family)